MLNDNDLKNLVGKPVDIESSAYLYRADRATEENPPESWFALMRYAGLPFDKPIDLNVQAIKSALCSLLWEEIRPIQTLKLIWADTTGRRPLPEELIITTFEAEGNSSSWWHNLKPVERLLEPDWRLKISDDGNTYVYQLMASTCGIVLSLAGKSASDYAVPRVIIETQDTWKQMNLEIEWGFDPTTLNTDYSGRIELYDGKAIRLSPLLEDAVTSLASPFSWNSADGTGARRGVKLSLLYMGTSTWRRVQPFTTQPDDVARTIITVWTKAGNFSFLAADLEHGPILAPEYGFFVRRTSELNVQLPPLSWISQATNAKEFIQELKIRKLKTIREQTRDHAEQTWEGAVTGIHGHHLPPTPRPPVGSEPPMQVSVPCERLTAQWNLGAWHLTRHSEINPETGRLCFNDYPYGILGSETYLILAALDMMGVHKAAEDGFEHWVSLPMQPQVKAGEQSIGREKELPDKHNFGSWPDRPCGNFMDGMGCFTLAKGLPGKGGHMDGVHPSGPGCIGWALTEHYWMTGDIEWLKVSAPRIKANAEWILRQRQGAASLVPGGDRLWCKGLQPAHQTTTDSGGQFLQWYYSESYYYAAVLRLAITLNEIDPEGAAKLMAEAEEYRKDLLAAVERSIALSPVVQVRDGTYHSVIPFACYMRGLGPGAWGWQRDGSGGHFGPLTFETDLSALPLMSVAGLFSKHDARLQGYLDVHEDRLLVDNPRTVPYSWFLSGWHHQVGLQKTIETHLACDDIPVFLRSFLNGYAIHILPNEEYVFNEHTHRGPADKIFEEAAFLANFRNLLVMEEGPNLWLARGTPRVWLEQGKKISVKNAPTHFGPIDYEIVSDVDNKKITATIKFSIRNTGLCESPSVKELFLRLRHPKSAPIKEVTVNRKIWSDFDPSKEIVRLQDLEEITIVEVHY